MGERFDTDGDTFTTGSLSLEDVQTFNANMDTNFNAPGGLLNSNGKTQDQIANDTNTFMQQANADGLNMAAAVQAAIDAGIDVDTAVAAALANGASPTSVAAALTFRGQTPAEITRVLVVADVPPAEATVAVRAAVPTATDTQLSNGLAAAGVTGDDALTAVAAAPAAAPPLTTTQTTNTVAAITSSGLLVGADGKAVTVSSEVDQLKAVIAFILQSARDNPDALDNAAVQQGISNIIGSALSAATGGQVSGSDAVATVLAQLEEASESGGDASSILQTAINDAIDIIEGETGVDLELPDSNSPS